MTTSRDIFDATKRYFGGRYQEGVELFDWDVNETNDELRWFLMNYAHALVGVSGRFETSSSKQLEVYGDSSTNNVPIRAGYASVNGRLVKIDSEFYYRGLAAPFENYLVKGTVTGVTEVTPTTDYNIVDANKAFVANHQLPGCLLYFTTGAMAGSGGTIDSLVSGTSFKVLADLSSVVAGDEYYILPPALTTPAGPQTDSLWLVTWFEETDSTEDADLLDPTLSVEPTVRYELRWCVYNNWGGASGTDLLNDFIAVKLCDIVRAAGQDAIITDYITNTANFVRVMDYLSDNLITAESNISTLQSDVLITQTDIAEINTALTVGDFVEAGFNYAKYVFSGSLNSGASRTFTIPEGQWFAPFYVPGADPFIVNHPGSTFINATAGESWLTIDIDDATGASFTEDTQETAGNVPDEDIAYLAIYDDGANIKRALPMGSIPVKQGLDWVCVDDGAGNWTLTVMPGQIIRNGTVLQKPASETIDPANVANLLTAASYSATSWHYVYLVNPTGTRALNLAIDTVEPLFDGRHPMNPSGWDAFCIGMLYYGAGGSPTPVCQVAFRNNRMYFTDDSTGKEYLWRSDAASTAGTITMPLGAVEAVFVVEGDLLVIASGSVEFYQQSGAAVVQHKRTISLFNDGSKTIRHLIRMPINLKALNCDSTIAGYSSGLVKIYLDSIVVDTSWMPTLGSWTD